MIGWSSPLRQSPCTNTWGQPQLCLAEGSIHLCDKLLHLYMIPRYHFTYHWTLSHMDALLATYGGSHSRGPCQRSLSNTGTENTVSNNIYGHSNQSIGNVSNSYNNTINVGVNEESLQIQAWLSPLEPHIRHQDVSHPRLDGIGDWVLQKNESETWREGGGGSRNPTLLCYGGHFFFVNSMDCF